MQPATLWVLGIGVAGVAAVAIYTRRQRAASGADIGTDALSEIQVTAEKIGLKNEPRGIRNNNPGNLEYLPPDRAWNGQVGSDGRYGVYDSAASGVRAMSKQLQKDYRTSGATTLRQLIMEWAPPTENDTQAYIDAVSGDTGLGPNDQFDLQSNLALIVAALIQHENGEQPYTYDELTMWVYTV